LGGKEKKKREKSHVAARKRKEKEIKKFSEKKTKITGGAINSAHRGGEKINLIFEGGGKKRGCRVPGRGKVETAGCQKRKTPFEKGLSWVERGKKTFLLSLHNRKGEEFAILNKEGKKKLMGPDRLLLCRRKKRGGALLPAKEGKKKKRTRPRPRRGGRKKGRDGFPRKK